MNTQKLTKRLSAIMIIAIIISCFTVLPVSAAASGGDMSVSEVAPLTAGNLYDGDTSGAYATVINPTNEAYSGKVTVKFSLDGRTIDTVTKDVTISAKGSVRIVTSKKAQLWFGNHLLKAMATIDGTQLPQLKKRVAVIDDKNPEPPVTEPTTEPTTKPTEKPTEPTTEKPTEPTTEKPTEPTTEKPTEPTTQPTTAPVEYGNPDLTITDISWEPASPNTGDKVVFSATVKNIGTKSTNANQKLGLRFDIGSVGEYRTWNDALQEPLKPGESRKLTATGGRNDSSEVSGNAWIAVSGTHTVIAIVDDDNKYEESNENNNTLQKTITVTDKQTPTEPTQPTEPPKPGERQGTAIAYPQQADFSAANGYSMTAGANNAKITMFKTLCNNSRRWVGNYPQTSEVAVAMFDIQNNGPVTVSLTFPNGTNASNTVVRPTDKGVAASVSGQTATFTLPGAGQYSIEPNGNSDQAVLIFVNKQENAPSGNVQTIARGTATEHWDWNLDGQTLYIAPGATLNGNVKFYGSGTVCGQGVITGNKRDTWLVAGQKIPIECWMANMTIKGVSILNSNAWCIQLQKSQRATVENVKIISGRPNGDGISLQSSENVTIKDCFIRTWDDGIVVKNYQGDMNSHDITATNCVLWTDLAQSMEIGFETNKGRNGDPRIYNVTFDKIYVIHAFHKAPISIHNGDNAKIYGVRFTNIYVDDIRTGQGDGWNLLVDITNLTGSQIGGADGWTTVGDRGTINDVTIDGLYVRGGNDDYRMRFDSSTGGSINGVTVKNYYHKGAKAGRERADIKSAGVNFE